MNNPLNLCPHGLQDDSGDCDECRFEHEAVEAAYEEKLRDEEDAHARYLASLDSEVADAYSDEPFFEIAL